MSKVTPLNGFSDAGMKKLEEMTENSDIYADFLKFHGRVFKHRVNVSLEFFTQRPDTKFIGEAYQWKRIGKNISQGSTAIRFCDENGNAVDMFDNTQTEDKQPPRVWTINSGNASEVKSEIGIAENQPLISGVIMKSIKPSDITDCMKALNISPSEFLKFLASYLNSVQIMIAGRLEIGGAKFNIKPDTYALSMLKNADERLIFLTYAANSARTALLQIERAALKINSERTERNDLREMADTDRGRTGEPAGRGTSGIAGGADAERNSEVSDETSERRAGVGIDTKNHEREQHDVVSSVSNGETERFGSVVQIRSDMGNIQGELRQPRTDNGGRTDRNIRNEVDGLHGEGISVFGDENENVSSVSDNSEIGGRSGMGLSGTVGGAVREGESTSGIEQLRRKSEMESGDVLLRGQHGDEGESIDTGDRAVKVDTNINFDEKINSVFSSESKETSTTSADVFSLEGTISDEDMLVLLSDRISDKSGEIKAFAKEGKFSEVIKAAQEAEQLSRRLDELKAKIQQKEITPADVDALRSIQPPRKSIQNLLDSEVAQTPKFEKLLHDEMGEKSAFGMRNSDNSWRTDESKTVPVTTVITRELPDKISELRKGENIKGINRGTFMNEDTGIKVLFSRKSIEETVAKAIQDNQRGRSVEARIAALFQIQEIIQNAICFDSELSEYNTVTSKNKSPNTLFMHRMYGVFKYNDEFFLANLAVEEIYQKSNENQIDSSMNRLYSFKDIKITPVKLGFDPHDRMSNDTGYVSSGATITIPQLYELVKTYDKNFFENPDAPGREERVTELYAQAEYQDTVNAISNEAADNAEKQEKIYADDHGITQKQARSELQEKVDTNINFTSDNIDFSSVVNAAIDDICAKYTLDADREHILRRFGKFAVKYELKENIFDEAFRKAPVFSRTYRNKEQLSKKFFDSRLDKIEDDLNAAILKHLNAAENTPEKVDTNINFSDSGEQPVMRQYLYSVQHLDDFRYFKVSEEKSDDVLKIASEEKSFQKLMELGDQISEEEYAEIEQSEHFARSIAINFDNNTAEIYTINDGMGGFSDDNRTDENTKFETVEISRNEYNVSSDKPEQKEGERPEPEQSEKIPTEEEVLYSKGDIARFIAEHTMSSDDWEEMARPLFENGYINKHQPSEKAAFGYHLSEPELYAIAKRFQQGEDIRREFALRLLEGGNSANIEFIFEDGKISDRTFYYAENLRHNLHLEKTENGYNCTFNGMERFVSFEEIGQSFLDRTHEEFEDLTYWAVHDFIKDDIPDISDDTVKQLITAFDSAAMADWEKGDNQPKINRIKKALYDILGDEDQTEKAFSCIAKHKYNVSFEPVQQQKPVLETKINDVSEEHEDVTDKLRKIYHDEKTSIYCFTGEESQLNLDTLSLITEKSEQYLIAAGSCILSNEFMQKHNITFLKYGRDLEYHEDTDRMLQAMRDAASRANERFTKLSEEDKQFIDAYPHTFISEPYDSPWGTVQSCREIAKGVFEVSTAGHGGIMIREELAEHMLSAEALEIGFIENGYHCFEKDADAQVALRELFDKGIVDIQQYVSEKYVRSYEDIGEWLNNTINDSISAFHSDYWAAHENAGESIEPPISSRPTITCEWSESSAFEEGKTYSAAEFDSIMRAADRAKVENWQKGIEKYGNQESWREHDEDDYYNCLGYDKTKFTVNMPDGTSVTERQDIGDGYGGTVEFLRRFGYEHIADVLQEDIEKYPLEETKVDTNINESDVIKRFREKTREKFDPINGISAAEIENTASEYARSIFEEYGIEAEIKNVILTGSRSRGLENDNSDIDIVIDVDSSLKEDSLFNILNEKQLLISGIKVDFNPIKADETGSLEDHLQIAEKYLAAKEPVDDKSAYLRHELNEFSKKHGLGELNMQMSGYGNDWQLVEKMNDGYEFVVGEIINENSSMPFTPETLHKSLEKFEERSEIRKSDIKTARRRYDELEKHGGTSPLPKEREDLPEIVYADNPTQKITNNLSAIRELIRLEDAEKSGKEPYEPRSDQYNSRQNSDSRLRSYSGWGGLPQIFDERFKNLEYYRDSLKKLLTEEEYSAAKSSTMNAHYTPQFIIDSMYKAVQKMGLSENSRILEPSCGTGNFISRMPSAIGGGGVVGVELDSITARIAKQLNKDNKNVEIIESGFEKTDLENNSFDLAIGNVPFGDYNLNDPDYTQDWLIHDAFIRKSLDKIAPGGVAALITSCGTMDKKSPKVREYLAEQAELIGAIRLPEGAFMGSAGTKTAADIIFLKKREEPLPKNEPKPDWCYVIPNEDL